MGNFEAYAFPRPHQPCVLWLLRSRRSQSLRSTFYRTPMHWSSRMVTFAVSALRDVSALMPGQVRQLKQDFSSICRVGYTLKSFAECFL